MAEDHCNAEMLKKDAAYPVTRSHITHTHTTSVTHTHTHTINVTTHTTHTCSTLPTLK